MSLWISISVAAAVFQTLRFMLQKVMAKQTLSATGATFARFLYSAPIIVVLTTLYLNQTGQAWPDLSPQFWMYAATGGLAQVLATVCVVLVFKSRNFAVGITFKKTEVILAVLVGIVVLGDQVSWQGLGAIVLGLIGVLLLSSPAQIEAWNWRMMFNRATGLGILSGALFAVSAVTYRGASLQLDMTDHWGRAGVTLTVVTSMQLTGMAIYLFSRERGEISAVWQARRVAGWIGILSMAGSFCWFTAFTLQNAAYVKAVGQIELIFSLLVTVLFFKEKISFREWIGVAVLGMSVLGMVVLA
ncbi:DMT family transporter [Ascidiaceihabitans sp.]|jgi:drug/metabolite transporter (DMT)-like permease|nr:DMT family transporter [Tateyamaria sp.]MDA9361571.1 DMT family transporter [Ascidiaceihabitans sp.]